MPPLFSRVLPKVLVALWLSICCTQSRAKAGYLRGASGNTAPTANNLMSTLDFAVLTNEGGKLDTWRASDVANFNFDGTFTAGSPLPGQKAAPALDTSAGFLYLYEVNNDFAKGNGNTITRVSVPLPVPIADITSWGYFSALGLADFAGPVTSANFFGSTRVRGNPAVASLGVTDPNVVALAADYVTPTDVFVAKRGKDATFTATFRGKSLLAAQGRSVIFGFTSPDAPLGLLLGNGKEFVQAGISGVGADRTPGGARGSVPALAPPPNPGGLPEPASAVLLASGMLLTVLLHRTSRGGHCAPRIMGRGVMGACPARGRHWPDEKLALMNPSVPESFVARIVP